MANKYADHLIILPEDDANRQIANGFMLHLSLTKDVQVLPPAGGWQHAVAKLTHELIPSMKRFTGRRLLLLIDADEDDTRFDKIREDVPDSLRDRVFVLGAFTEPEDLRRELSKNFEKIGETLADECYEDGTETWQHQLLEHNEKERVRLMNQVKPFLFL